MNADKLTAVVRLREAELELGGRTLWHELNLELKPGEFVAVLGPNGSGKTSLLQVLLGQLPLSSGLVEVCGEAPRRGSNVVGYVPQQRAFDADLPVRGRDIVRLGIDGHRFGVGLSNQKAERRVNEMIAKVGVSKYADVPIGLLSGGEQQRLRIAQALAGEPRVLLCDEPLLSLDLSHQQAVSGLIDQQRRETGMAVLFVTHEINPILPMVDRVLYLVGGRFAVGRPQEVLTSERLSQLYGTVVDVLHVHGRVVVVGTGEALAPDGHHPAHSGDEEKQS